MAKQHPESKKVENLRKWNDYFEEPTDTLFMWPDIEYSINVLIRLAVDKIKKNICRVRSCCEVHKFRQFQSGIKTHLFHLAHNNRQLGLTTRAHLCCYGIWSNDRMKCIVSLLLLHSVISVILLFWWEVNVCFKCISDTVYLFITLNTKYK